MKKEIKKLWPELNWIKNEDLRERVAATWELAFEKSVLTPEDLERIPFTLLVEDCKVSFMAHKRAVVHIAYESAKVMQKFFGDNLPINLDVVLAGAILADVGKLVEYEKDGDTIKFSKSGTLLRHAFTGVSLAQVCGVPDEVCHIIAVHSKEGDAFKRTTEGLIVHHADFMAYLPFKNEKG
ncbi:MAG: HDIG domain-containing protein [Candidatus Cloacimonetes bacterium]|nr:HDIG domain-containing protein [Candidatus Cloacimonadota bacterium]MBL7086688.1 HDIG domain-containing protein [Candidatus Cloacimonadota bacterium]